MMIGSKWIVAPEFQQNPHWIIAFKIDLSIGLAGGVSQWEESYGTKVLFRGFPRGSEENGVRNPPGEWDVKKRPTLQ